MKKRKVSVKASSVSKKVSSQRRLADQKKKLLGFLVLLFIIILGAWAVTSGQSLLDFRGWAAGKTCKDAGGQGSCVKIKGCSWVPNQVRQSTQACAQRDCEKGRAGCHFIKNKNGKTQCQGSYKVNEPSKNGKCIGVAADVDDGKNGQTMPVFCKDLQTMSDQNGKTTKICKNGKWQNEECVPNSVKCQSNYTANGRPAYIQCNKYGELDIQACGIGQVCINGRGCVTMTY